MPAWNPEDSFFDKWIKSNLSSVLDIMSHFDEEKQLRREDVTQASTHEDDGQIITSQRPKLADQLNRFLSQLGAEERGIERVLPDERSNQAPFPRPPHVY